MVDRQITAQIDNRKNVTTVDISTVTKVMPRKMDEIQMQRDMDYILAQKILSRMLENGLISDDEFNKITALNRKSFSPYLTELYE
jgi:patatin-like phospholipase/acyl hydrolase